MIEDFRNHGRLKMDSKSISASCIWFCDQRKSVATDEHGDHTVRSAHSSFVLHKTLIISTQGCDEEQTMNTFEAVNPFLPLRPLSTDVEHMIRQLTEFEEGLCDTGCT